MKKVIVVSVGGSIIVPDKVDTAFLSELKEVMQRLRKKYRIIICTGGGSVAREYISALRDAGLSNVRQDIMGISATRLNAKLVSMILDANDEVPVSVQAVKKLMKRHDIIVCGGLKPGQTTDAVTADIARAVAADMLINMTNVSGLYDKDPAKHADAHLIPKISHEDFAKMIAKVKKEPGQHFVLDEKAARVAGKAGIKVVILMGLDNMLNYLEGKCFVGTVVS